MTNVTFVTGNPHKAKYFSELIGLPIDHHSVDGHEIQSLDLEEIAEHKAKTAFEQLQRPVIVEDVSLVISCLGRLPGPFIRWFVDEAGLEEICRLADPDKGRRAVVSSIYAYFDGKDIKYFRGSLKGKIAQHPKGKDGFGWNPTFIPDGANKTLAMMDDATFKNYYLKIKAISNLGNFLQSIDKN